MECGIEDSILIKMTRKEYNYLYDSIKLVALRLETNETYVKHANEILYSLPSELR